MSVRGIRRLEFRWLAVGPAALLILLFLIIPAGLGLGSTFTNYSQSQSIWQFTGIANYQKVLADRTTGTAFVNGILLTLMTVPLEMGLGLGLAALLRRPFRGRSLLRTLLLVPWLVSPIAAGVMWHFLYNAQVGLLGWVGAWLGVKDISNPLANPGWALPSLALTEIWRLTPLAAFLLLPGVAAVPQDNLDYATLAGSPPWTTWRSVIFPRIQTLILIVLLLLVGQSLTTFDDVLILTGGGPGSRTMTPALYSYNLVTQTHNWPQGTTVAWMLVGLVLVAAVIYLVLWRREAE